MAAPVLGPSSPVDVADGVGGALYSWFGGFSVCALSDTLMIAAGDVQPTSGSTSGLKAQAVAVGSDGSVGTQGGWADVAADFSSQISVAALDATHALVCYVSASDRVGHCCVLTVDPTTLVITVGTEATFQASYRTSVGPDGLYQQININRDYGFATVGLSSTAVLVFYDYDHSKGSGFFDSPGPTNQRKTETRCCLLSVSGTTVTPQTPVSIAGPSVRGYTNNGPASGVNGSGATVTPSNNGSAAYVDGAVQRYNSGAAFYAYIRDQGAKLSSSRAAYLFYLPAVNIEADGWGSTYLAVIDVTGTTASVTSVRRVSKGRLYYFAGPTHTYALVDAQDGHMPMALGVAGGYLVIAENFWVRSSTVTDPLVTMGTTSETVISSDAAGYWTNLKTVDPNTGAVGTAVTIGTRSGGSPVLVSTGDGRCLLGFYDYGASTVLTTWQYLSVDSGGAITLDTDLDLTAQQDDDLWWTRAAPIGLAAAFAQDTDSHGTVDNHAQYYTVGTFTLPPPPTIELGRVAVQFVL